MTHPFANLEPNTWTRLSRDEDGARRHCALRYVPEGGYFLWGYLSYDVFIYGGPHLPRKDNPEYDLVMFDPAVGAWKNQFPVEKAAEWTHALPPMYLCQNYHGITTGSYRPQLKMRDGVLRPDLNIVFDQVTYDSKRARMVYFTGGRTFGYDMHTRSWADIAPGGSPPPVLGGSLCYDPFNDEIVLVGGGHVAERGSGGRLAGYTGTWIFDCQTQVWRRLDAALEPPPRMATRLVCDRQNAVLVLFGGDAQTHFLADTWVYDTRTRRWRLSKAAGSPLPRAGHVAVWDATSGWVLIAGGYNRDDLTDMWAYDAAGDRWMKAKGEVPVGWYITGDIDEEGVVLLTTATESTQTGRKCDVLFLVRTTYAFKTDPETLIDERGVATRHEPMPKRSAPEATAGTTPNASRRKKQAARLTSMLENEWVLLSEPGRAAPLRTWGSCAFDTDRGQIIYWGGGHCGYGGNDYDFYDVAEHTWISSPAMPDDPPRAWNRGINLAGVTFNGAPWVRHGRKVYAYDPVSKRVINTKAVYLTAGYDPELLRECAPVDPYFGAGENFETSGYTKWTTWSYDRETETWDLVCSGYPGLDLVVSTPHGVMGVDYNWGMFNRANRTDVIEYEGEQVVENAVYLLDVGQRQWQKLSGDGPYPQHLYEMTALVHDAKRDRLILHGAGPAQDELWTFDLRARKWMRLDPQMKTPDGKPPVCRREAVYLPGADAFFTCGYPAGDDKNVGTYIYRLGEHAWHRVDVPAPPGRHMKEIAGQNRAMAYDPARDVVLMVLGEGPGNLGKVEVYALKYRDQ